VKVFVLAEATAFFPIKFFPCNSINSVCCEKLNLANHLSRRTVYQDFVGAGIECRSLLRIARCCNDGWLNPAPEPIPEAHVPRHRDWFTSHHFFLAKLVREGHKVRFCF
jgi:hypothetical protein